MLTYFGIVIISRNSDFKLLYYDSKRLNKLTINGYGCFNFVWMDFYSWRTSPWQRLTVEGVWAENFSLVSSRRWQWQVGVTLWQLGQYLLIRQFLFILTQDLESGTISAGQDVTFMLHQRWFSLIKHTRVDWHQEF